MRVFSGGLATETNTFAPMPTGLESYKDRGYFAAGQHPNQLTFFAAPLASGVTGLAWRSSVSITVRVKISGTSPIPVIASSRRPLLTAIPADSCPRCCWAYIPR